MTDEPDGKRWRHCKSALIVILALVIAYPFSMGPVMWLETRTGRAGSWELSLYRPIISAMVSYEPFGNVMSRYISFWGVEVGWDRDPKRRSSAVWHAGPFRTRD
jgi:hypothetical protein